MSSQHSYTEAEAVALARQFDLIAAMPVAFKGEVGAMRAANPDLTVIAYANATFLSGGAGVPETEFAHDLNGRRIKSTNFGNYLMEPSKPNWRKIGRAWCRES